MLKMLRRRSIPAIAFALAALGALWASPAPAKDLRGKTRIRRNGKVLWEADFLSGEKNMCHSIANLEHYHFRYPMFRRPGDLHAHFFGAAELSYLAGIRTEPGDEFEIDVPAMGKALRNRMESIADSGLVTVNRL